MDDSPDVVHTLRVLGIPEHTIARAVERGDPEAAIFEAVVMPAMAERTATMLDIERRGGLTVGQTEAFMSSFGLHLPPPDEPVFTPREAEVLIELASLQDVWPVELDIRLGRVWGPLIARIAQAAVQLFREQLEPRLRADDPDPLAGVRAVQEALARLLPLADPVLLGVHKRWLEHELAQAVVSQAETSAEGHVLPGAVRVAFLFCDLKDFTAFADARGDAAAVAAVDRFAETVATQHGDGVRLMKALGDGFMLVYEDAAPAVAAGARIIDAMRRSTPLGVHAGVHYGNAIARDGDYFGGAVNLTARLLAAAGRDELVGTHPVVERTANGFAWEPAGVRDIRGIAQPVEIFRLGDRSS